MSAFEQSLEQALKIYQSLKGVVANGAQSTAQDAAIALFPTGLSVAFSIRERLCEAKMSDAPTFFPTAADFRRWLAANHATAPELLVGFWKKSSGRPSIDWPQARDQALCFGWIDGIRKSLGDDAYTIRFTPRRKGSIWSKVNVARYEALTASRHMTPAGVRAYEENKHKSGLYSYEKP